MKKQNAATRILAMLLCVVMVVALLPATALPVSAADIADDGNIYYVNEDFAEKPSYVTARSNLASGAGGLCMAQTDYEAATYADGVFTGANQWWAVNGTFSHSYTVEFTCVAGSQTWIYIGNNKGSSGAEVNFCVQGDANGGDRVAFYNSSSLVSANYFRDFNGLGTGSENTYGTHTVKVRVDRTAKTYQLYLDGVQVVKDEVSNFGFWKTLDSAFGVYFSGTIGLSDVKVYTEAFSVNQQATLDSNIQMTFSGTAIDSTGITTVKATMDSVTKTATVTDDAYSLTLDVAPARIGETITLEGLNGEGTAVITKTYTVKDYLEAVVEANSTDTELVALCNNLLNYGSAAAAHFGKTAVTAPDLTLAEIPEVVKAGGGVNVATTNNVEFSYYKATAITDTYTVEFTYRLDVGNTAYIKIGPDTGSTGLNVQLYLRAGSDTNNDRVSIFTNPTSSAAKTYDFANAADGGKHAIKVTVDTANGTYALWMDGVQISYNDSTDIPCAKRSDATETNGYNATYALKYVGFDVETGSINLYDLKVSNNTETLYETTFETLETATNASSVTDQGFVDAKGSATLLARNPLATTFSGEEGTYPVVNSATLLFQNQVKVRFRLTLPTDTTGLSATLNGSGAELAAAIDSDGILPQNYGEDQTLVITNGTDTVTVTYCPLEYMSRMYRKDTTSETMKVLVKAMYNYYLAAKAYTPA